jgi:hypothetical protein
MQTKVSRAVSRFRFARDKSPQRTSAVDKLRANCAVATSPIPKHANHRFVAGSFSSPAFASADKSDDQPTASLVAFAIRLRRVADQD